MSSINMDYKSNQFKYLELTRIIGEPTTSCLIVILKEVQANASSVQSDLGSSEDGHLGLVCSNKVYEDLIPMAIPYIWPDNPGRLQVEQGMTQHAIAQIRNEHAEATRVFREVIGVKRALRQQIVTAVERKFLCALRTPGANKLTHTIPAIFEHLFSTYGYVTPQDLRELMTRVESISFPPQEPLDTIFSEINDLATIAEYANAPITAFQKINMAYFYFQKCGIFKSALTRWDDTEDDAKIWPGCKDHFRAAHKAMKRTGALTTQDTLNRDTVAHMVQEELHQVLLASQESPDLLDITAPDNISTGTSLIPQATATTTSSSTTSIALDITMQTFQQQMAMMQQLMMQQIAMSQQTDSTSTSSHKNKRKWNQQKYCWTHGACNHNSPDCRTKADRHQDSATFQHCKGGSTKILSDYLSGLVFLLNLIY